MKILVLGSRGMVGHVMAQYLKEQNHDVAGAARSKSDYFINVEDRDSINLALLSENYDFVINCIGLLVNESNKNFEQAILVNSWFPHYLEKLLAHKPTKLVHISTDCVFSGDSGNYVETDPHDETNYYGRSKSLGEVVNNKDVTFRTSIIGPEIRKNTTGLLEWILKNPNSDIPGWENAWWSGITSLELAKAVSKYILNPAITGVYHLTGSLNRINKYELLCLINEVYGLNKRIIKTTGPKKINKILINTREKEQSFDLPDYKTMIEEMKAYTYRTGKQDE